ncbi:MAG: ribosome-associated translation inhibitor RaiA [Lysobacterales bacterium]
MSELDLTPGMSRRSSMEHLEIEMQINITGHHIEVTPALRAYATEKVQRITRHFDHVISTDVILKVEKNLNYAEGKINAAGAPKALFAQESNEDMYAAIDGLADKLDKLVRRHKDRLRGHHASSAKRATNV